MRLIILLGMVTAVLSCLRLASLLYFERQERCRNCVRAYALLEVLLGVLVVVLLGMLIYIRAVSTYPADFVAIPTYRGRGGLFLVAFSVVVLLGVVYRASRVFSGRGPGITSGDSVSASFAYSVAIGAFALVVLSALVLWFALW